MSRPDFPPTLMSTVRLGASCWLFARREAMNLPVAIAVASDVCISNIGGVPTIKTLLLGDIKTGKTKFSMAIAGDQFIDDYKATIGVDCQEAELSDINHSSGIKIKFNLWDVAGEERLGRMTNHYYKDWSLALFFGQEGRKQQTGVQCWMQDLQAKSSLEARFFAVSYDEDNKILLSPVTNIAAINSVEIKQVPNKHVGPIGRALLEEACKLLSVSTQAASEPGESLTLRSSTIS